MGSFDFDFDFINYELETRAMHGFVSQNDRRKKRG